MTEYRAQVLKQLQEDGSIGAIEAELRAKLFLDIKQNASQAAKKEIGLEGLSKNAQKVHNDEDLLMAANLVTDFLDHHQMKHAKSIYVEEMGLPKDPNRGRHARELDLQVKYNESIVVSMMKKLQEQKQQIFDLQSKIENTQAFDEIREEIDDEVNELEEIDPLNKAGQDLLGSSDNLVMSGAISQSELEDQSINTQGLEVYDYVEDVLLKSRS